MIIGAHSILYSKDAEADRAFLRDILELGTVDAGDGWLIFRLPPAELGVHPSEENDVHELFLMCDDLEALVRDLTSRGVETCPPQDASWGTVTRMMLPGGGKLGVYQPRHLRPRTLSGWGTPPRLDRQKEKR